MRIRTKNYLAETGAGAGAGAALGQQEAASNEAAAAARASLVIFMMLVFVWWLLCGALAEIPWLRPGIYQPIALSCKYRMKGIHSPGFVP